MQDLEQAIWICIGLYALVVSAMMVEKTIIGQRVYRPLMRLPLVAIVMGACAYNHYVLIPTLAIMAFCVTHQVMSDE